MSTRLTQSFAILSPIGAALALALLGAPHLVAQEPPAAGAPASAARQPTAASPSTASTGAGQPTLVAQAQAQLAQAQAQLAQAQQQLERALALAQRAQVPAGAEPAPVKIGAGEAAPAKAAGHEPATVVQALLRTQPEPVVSSPPALTPKASVS